jgi:hypothetical protein
MADNVMALVKKKGSQKKLRGKAAQRRKARASAPVKSRRVPDKRNPFRPFKDMDPCELSEEIDNFVANAGWTQERQVPDLKLDREIVKMFTILKSGIPFPLVKTFFNDFDDSDSLNIVRYFDEFTQRPYVRARIENMKDIIRRRQAIPLTARSDDKRGCMNQVERKYRAKVLEEGKIGDRDVSPAQRPKIMFGSGEILSQCEREYRRAPWMFPFSDQVIRGFAIKGIDPQFTIPQEVQDGWHKVNTTWYRMACEGKRVFSRGNVAYVTVNDDLIVETEEMYNASKLDWIREFTPLAKDGFDIAIQMIINNDVLKSTHTGEDLIDYVEEIIASFGQIDTNYELARKISYVLVFLLPLIDGPQIYHKRIRNDEYPGMVLVNLDRYTLLPEVFRDPDVDKTPIEAKIKRMRRTIENRYYELVKLKDPTIRKQARQTVVDIPLIESPEISENEDSIRVTPEIAPDKPVVRRIVVKELAPGLFQKLRERISMMTPIYCSQCNAEVFAPPFTTPVGTRRLKFCNKECFDMYDI